MINKGMSSGKIQLQERSLDMMMLDIESRSMKAETRHFMIKMDIELKETSMEIPHSMIRMGIW